MAATSPLCTMRRDVTFPVADGTYLRGYVHTAGATAPGIAATSETALEWFCEHLAIAFRLRTTLVACIARIASDLACLFARLIVSQRYGVAPSSILDPDENPSRSHLRFWRYRP